MLSVASIRDAFVKNDLFIASILNVLLSKTQDIAISNLEQIKICQDSNGNSVLDDISKIRFT